MVQQNHPLRYFFLQILKDMAAKISLFEIEPQ